MTSKNKIYTNNNAHWNKIYNFVLNNKNLSSKNITLFELNNNNFPNKILYNREWHQIHNHNETWEYFELCRKPILDELNTNIYDCFIEFGAGWGRNIFHFLEKDTSNKIDYYLLEYTEFGLKTANQIKKVHPNYNLNIMEFDYNNSSKTLDKIKKYDNILMTSFWSIEQVTNISKDFFNNILKLGNKITFIHIEPVGWQIDPTSLTKDFKTGGRVYYNKNLYSELKNNDQINITEIKIDFFNFYVGGSAGTLIKWNKK